MMIRDEESVLPAASLESLLRYDPLSGDLYWRTREGADAGTKSFNVRFAGKVAGSLVKTGYVTIVISIDGKHYQFRAHRIAWALVTGEWPRREDQIDHRNNRRSDNRWSNLRLAAHCQNGASKTLAKNNTTGFKGVTYRRALLKPWKAQIRRGNKKVSLGYFSSPREAALAYDAAALLTFGDFAKTNKAIGIFDER